MRVCESTLQSSVSTLIIYPIYHLIADAIAALTCS